MIDTDDTVKEIREAVKAYKDDTAESKVVAEVEPSDETEKGVEQETEEKEETEKTIPMKEDGTKDSLLYCYIKTLTQEEVLRVLTYMKKQSIGDMDAVNEVIRAWK